MSGYSCLLYFYFKLFYVLVSILNCDLNMFYTYCIKYRKKKINTKHKYSVFMFCIFTFYHQTSNGRLLVGVAKPYSGNDMAASLREALSPVPA